MRLPVLKWRIPELVIVLVAAGALCVGGMTLLLQPAGSALAAQPNCGTGPFIDFGRYEFCGYFYNQLETFGARLWNGGIPVAGAHSANSLNTFIRFIEEDLPSIPGVTGGDPGPYAVDGQQGITAADFVVDTMISEQPPNNLPQFVSTAEINDWINRLRKGVAKNIIDIDYNANVDWHCGQEDTLYQDALAAPPLAARNGDVAFYHTFPGGETPNCYRPGIDPRVTVPSILITNHRTGAVIYTIKRICGNPFGNLSPLPAVEYKMTPDGFLNNTTVTTGQNDVLHVSVTHDNEDVASDVGTLEVGVTRPGGGTAFYSGIENPCTNSAPPVAGPPCTPSGQTGLNGAGSSAHGFQATARDPAFAGAAGAPDWWWTTRVYHANDSGSATVNFTVAPNATPGTYTFHICYDPTDDEGDTQCVTKDLVVQAISSPSVVATNSDVQAGGGLCDGGTMTNGNITGNNSAASLGQYVVSASGIIGGFGSNNSVSGSAGDTLGINNYAQICRPDLLLAAKQYVAGGGTGYSTIGVTGRVTTWDATGKSGLYYFAGGQELDISGVVSNKITLIATNAAVEVVVSGPITINGGSNRQNIPSLGVISAGDIDILSGVTVADAYFFANGAINTCGIASTPALPNNPAKPCGVTTPVLTVDGFFMAHDILLSRLGPTNVSGKVVAEQVNLNPELYLNPPKFFDAASVDQTELNGQGERQPLF